MYEIKQFHRFDMPEAYERLKVAALNLFRPTASPSLKVHIATQSPGERGRVRSGGFTLIEVVVATAILGIALTVIIELFAGGLRLARTSREYTKAVSYVNSKMEEIDSKQTFEEGVTEGEFDETFHWRVATSKVNILSGEKPWEVKLPIDLFKIKVDVTWKSGSKERSTGTETYRTMKVQSDEKKS